MLPRAALFVRVCMCIESYNPIRDYGKTKLEENQLVWCLKSNTVQAVHQSSLLNEIFEWTVEITFDCKFHHIFHFVLLSDSQNQKSIMSVLQSHTHDLPLYPCHSKVIVFFLLGILLILHFLATVTFAKFKPHICYNNSAMSPLKFIFWLHKAPYLDRLEEIKY